MNEVMWPLITFAHLWHTCQVKHHGIYCKLNVVTGGSMTRTHWLYVTGKPEMRTLYYCHINDHYSAFLLRSSNVILYPAIDFKTPRILAVKNRVSRSRQDDFIAHWFYALSIPHPAKTLSWTRENLRRKLISNLNKVTKHGFLKNLSGKFLHVRLENITFQEVSLIELASRLCGFQSKQSKIIGVGWGGGIVTP